MSAPRKRIFVNETPAETTPERPSYEELTKAAQDVVDFQNACFGCKAHASLPSRLRAAHALIARATKDSHG